MLEQYHHCTVQELLKNPYRKSHCKTYRKIYFNSKVQQQRSARYRKGVVLQLATVYRFEKANSFKSWFHGWQHFIYIFVRTTATFFCDQFFKRIRRFWRKNKKLIKFLYYKLICLVDIWIKLSQKGLAKPQSKITNIYFRKENKKIKRPSLYFLSGNINLLYYWNFIIPFVNFPMLIAKWLHL